MPTSNSVSGTRIRLAISTCPNDTFAFHALMSGLVDTGGLHFDVKLLDIEQLNQQLPRKKFDVLKASFAAAVDVSTKYWVLPSGSALGFGVGPLLLASPQTAEALPCSADQLTLCPGANTTAAMLFRMFYPHTTRIEHAVFSDIMPALQAGRANFGVCIHEGRFTYRQQGLQLVSDLGTQWEQATQCPLPLGGILASRDLPPEMLTKIQRAIRHSLEFALANPEQALPTMRRHAQEFDDEVLMQHVDLYVNDWTVDLGPLGAQTLVEFSQRAGQLQAAERGALEIWQS